MSHHLDSPASRRDGRLNITDLYVFDGDDGTVLTMVTNSSLAGEARKPGFHPEARYEFRIHSDSEQTPYLVYRLSFADSDDGGTQVVTVSKLTGVQAADDAASGTVVAEGRTGIATEGDGLRLWAGEAADPFYLDLAHLDRLLDGLQHRRPVDLKEWTAAGATSSFTGSRTSVIVLEIPFGDDLPSGARIGVWAATELATDAGGWHQTNRAAIPMMWPLFHALGGDDDSPEYQRDTVGQPADDRGTIGPRIADLVTAAVAPTGIGDPDQYGQIVAERLTPDLLPYRVGTPAGFSFAGFNGRRFADNAPEVMYGLVFNRACETGLVAADAAETRQEKFPYVVPSA